MNTSTTIARALDAAAPGAFISLDRSWWGFGGVHGGLALGLLTAAMRARAQGRVLRQVSGHFRRALREPFELDVPEQGAGRMVSWLDARAIESGRLAISATAVFADPGERNDHALAPRMPAAPPPMACPVFTVPEAFAPFSRHTEIRPVGSAKPFGGGAEPELMAWLRLIDDDRPPDEARLVLLMDALAPSYAAVLDTPVAMPTLSLSVMPGWGLAAAASPWLLLRASTDACGRDGWLRERLDAWAPDGTYLGSGEQLRVVMDGKASA
ncbi:MAG: thioesterase family protein [Burkholderiaceae bacterium]